MSEALPSPQAGRLTRRDARTLTLAALGGALEFYDFIIFVFFTVVIGHLFFPPDMPEWLQVVQTYGIFAAGYLARPLGGIVMAHFGDLVGRKRMFTFSVFLMAVPTLLIGLMPTYESIGYAAPILLLVMRMAQGAAIGGEAPGAWVFVAEHVPANRVGIACGMLTGGLTAGILLGSLMATAINVIYLPEQVAAFAWRIPFLVGGVFGLIAMYLRRWLDETPVFEAMRSQARIASVLPLKQVLRGHGRAVVMSMMATWMLTAAIVVVILMTPTLMQKLHQIAAADTLIANVAATVTLTISAVVTGAALDRFGPVRVTLVGGLALIAGVYALYLGTAADPSRLLPLYAVVGFCVGVVSIVPYLMVHAFPAAVRFTGLSFSYNVAYAVFGGLTPLAVSMMTAVNPLAPAHYVAAIVVIGIATVLVNALAVPRLAIAEVAAGQPAR
ncbi:MFS transporter [Oleomonas cavernae]|uniref:MFS transporter n=1 Tax=Oleomonas cavernae TaxID=2320859 RepID=A0A418W9N2_9PROT|nr:MFS transporter [Oleomonas cavernae]RJF86732.1 MFS transporter [Oleomonas cavernae]